MEPAASSGSRAAALGATAGAAAPESPSDPDSVSSVAAPATAAPVPAIFRKPLRLALFMFLLREGRIDSDVGRAGAREQNSFGAPERSDCPRLVRFAFPLGCTNGGRWARAQWRLRGRSPAAARPNGYPVPTRCGYRRSSFRISRPGASEGAGGHRLPGGFEVRA